MGEQPVRLRHGGSAWAVHPTVGVQPGDVLADVMGGCAQPSRDGVRRRHSRRSARHDPGVAGNAVPRRLPRRAHHALAALLDRRDARWIEQRPLSSRLQLGQRIGQMAQHGHEERVGNMLPGFMADEGTLTRARAELVANPLPQEVMALLGKWKYSPPDEPAEPTQKELM